MKKTNLTIGLIRYAAKMLTMPVGTEFESYGRRVNRFTYTARTVAILRGAERRGA